MYISSLQYITCGKTAQDIEREVRSVLNGGIDWIQLRMKEATNKELLEVAKRVRELCYSYNATFIVNDNPQVALESKADGVHLGKGDMPTSVVREIYGNKIIIGRTANSVRDIEILSKQKIDYIGLGPYKFTTTKENLSDILGIEGYISTFSALKSMDIAPPFTVAIGGIELSDIAQLASIGGIDGVAVSGSISRSDNITKTAMEFTQEVEQHFLL